MVAGIRKGCDGVNQDEKNKYTAKAIVAAAFRNGEIENVHAGEICPTCFGKSEYSHISQAEMKAIMTDAVNRMYTILCWLETDPQKFHEVVLGFHGTMVKHWDEPKQLELF